MADIYPNNSNKAKESSLIRDEPKPAPAGTHIPVETRRSEPHVRKKRKISTIHEVLAALFPGGFAEVKEHLLWDIFVPWVQDMLHNGWQQLGNVIFPGSGASNKGQQVPERVSYNDHYRIKGSEYPSYDSVYPDGMRPYPTEKEAYDVLQSLHDEIMRYGYVTLLIFNEMVGNRTNSSQENYGWLNINTAFVERVRGGWVIRMPKAVPIERNVY